MKFDLILCRNVLIYFDKDLQSRVLGLFDNSSFPNAYLCIGSKESIQYLGTESAETFAHWKPGTEIYKKHNH